MGFIPSLRESLVYVFAGAATGLFISLYRDYKFAKHSHAQQMKGLHGSFDRQNSSLEKLKQTEAPQQVEATK